MSKLTATQKTETWKKFSTVAGVFAKTDGIDEFDAMSITRLVEKGNANPKRQSRCTASIRTICMDIAGNPFGGQSALSPATVATLAEAHKAIAGVAALFDKGGAIVQGLLVPHGRTVVKDSEGATMKDDDGNGIKKTHYEDGADFRQTLDDAMDDNALRLQKAGWNGTVEGLETLIAGGSN
jgi:hypothetical protein